MNKFAVSAQASKLTPTQDIEIHHTVFLLLASSLEEAQELGLQMCKKAFPRGMGWNDHSVQTCTEDLILDPALEITYRQEG